MCSNSAGLCNLNPHQPFASFSVLSWPWMVGDLPSYVCLVKGTAMKHVCVYLRCGTKAKKSVATVRKKRLSV